MQVSLIPKRRQLSALFWFQSCGLNGWKVYKGIEKDHVHANAKYSVLRPGNSYHYSITNGVGLKHRIKITTAAAPNHFRPVESGASFGAGGW